ncbi:DUF397 domain-containing protein [Streptomyces iakyrus]|uniref:DUF397 domain-containing protein n=1 Tax=Streptomyces iakyrus TaxID=68219 RepID=UPI00369C7B98
MPGRRRPGAASHTGRSCPGTRRPCTSAGRGKNPDGPVLVVGRSAWAAFTAAL